MSTGDDHRHLIDGYCSGNLTDAEFEQLEEALRQSPELRRELLETRMLDSDLRDYASGSIGLPGVAETTPIPRRVFGGARGETWAMAAVILFLFCVLGVLFFRVGNDAQVDEFDEGVAVLTRVIGAEWTSANPRQGDSMVPGKWILENGTAELEFYSGASVILEGPAVLELLSENSGKLFSGKLRAEVPLQAHGFKVVTPQIEVVDLGTAFGMKVEPAGGTSVHVFDGEVELYKADERGVAATGQSLHAGEGRRIDRFGDMSEIKVDEGEFLSPAEFDRRSRVLMEQGIHRWEVSAAQLANREDLVAYFDFQPESPTARSLMERRSRGDEGVNGSIIGAKWEQGRWPGKGALDFKRPSDRVRILVPGVHDSLTLVAWVRIDGFDNKYSSLLLSDGWGQPGAVHWQIYRDSEIALAIWYGKKETLHSHVPFVMTQSDFGRWMQLAVVYDGEAGTVSYYRDGEPIGTEQAVAGLPLVIGEAEIGNWTPSFRKERQVRNFNGRMDEFLIFDQPLGPEEVESLYQNGKP